MIGISLGIEAGKYIWHNRKAIMRAYHTHVAHHHVMLDDLIDMAEEHPNHPANSEFKKDLPASDTNKQKDC